MTQLLIFGDCGTAPLDIVLTHDVHYTMIESICSEADEDGAMLYVQASRLSSHWHMDNGRAQIITRETYEHQRLVHIRMEEILPESY